MFRQAVLVAVSAALALSSATAPDVRSCFTGTCTVSVSAPVDIPLDGRAGPTVLSVVAVTSYAVTLRVLGGPNSGSISMTGAGGRMTFGSDRARIAVRVRSIEQGTAVLDVVTTVR